MNENPPIFARSANRYPPEKFVPDLEDFDYFAQFMTLDDHICSLYQDWFLREIIDNRFLMFNVFIRKVPHAVSLFEEIINSDNFFKYIICQIKEFTPMRKIINNTGFCIIKYPKRFTECLIIPDIWRVALKYDYNHIQEKWNTFRDTSAVNFFIKCDRDHIQTIRREFPIKIDFSDDCIQFIKYKF